MSPLGRIVHKTRTHTVIDAKHPKPDQVNAVQFVTAAQLVDKKVTTAVLKTGLVMFYVYIS